MKTQKFYRHLIIIGSTWQTGSGHSRAIDWVTCRIIGLEVIIVISNLVLSCDDISVSGISVFSSTV